MEKEWPSHKWISDDPVRSFMETLKKRALERYSAVKYLIPLLLNLNKMFSFKKKSKNFKAKRRETNLVDGIEAFTRKTL